MLDVSAMRVFMVSGGVRVCVRLEGGEQALPETRPPPHPRKNAKQHQSTERQLHARTCWVSRSLEKTARFPLRTCGKKKKGGGGVVSDGDGIGRI